MTSEGPFTEQLLIVLDQVYDIAPRLELYCAPAAHHMPGLLEVGARCFSPATIHMAGEIRVSAAALMRVE